MGLTEKLKAIADAIRSKTGETELLTLDAMPSAIEGIQTGGGGSDAELIALFEGTATEFTVPNGCTEIRQRLFYGYANLVSISLPDGITNIGEYAFYGCSNLVLTSLPSNLEIIANYALSNCTKMELKSIPNSVKEVNICSFAYCHGLSTITFEGKPTMISSRAFQNCSNLKTINVPWAEGAVANAPWGATNATIVYNYTGR